MLLFHLEEDITTETKWAVVELGFVPEDTLAWLTNLERVVEH